MHMRGDLPLLASRRHNQGTPEEYQAVVQGSVAYFGTYTVNEAEKTSTVHIEGTTFANLIGGEQKRLVTSLTADELKSVYPTTQYGERIETDWRRAK